MAISAKGMNVEGPRHGDWRLTVDGCLHTHSTSESVCQGGTSNLGLAFDCGIFAS